LKNVFIIGAGANKEIGMPTGIELKKEIIELLSFSSTYSEEPDSVLFDCIKRKAEKEYGEIKRYRKAAKKIYNALSQAISIDNFIDAHRGDKYIEFCAKIGIVFSILKAEKKSSLYENTSYSSNFELPEKSWYHPFFQLLIENCNKEEFENRLKDIGFIIFNYDRCFEHYFFKALQTYYAISENEAGSLVNKMNIIHPYGTVGSLVFQKHDTRVPFGEEAGPYLILELTEKIKTFTESQNEESENKKKIFDYFSDATKIIFLGFAYHKINLNLLFGDYKKDLDNNLQKPISCYGSAYNISRDDISSIKESLNKILGESTKIKLVNKTSKSFFDYFWRSISF